MSIVPRKNHRKIDLSGGVFGRWTVIAEADRTKDGKVKWLCQCECGTTRSVNGKHLRSGASTSCGFHPTGNSSTNGLYSSRTYKIWRAMIQRCSNPNSSRWRDYGGRGIAVCDRWKNFESFLADMGEAPNGKSIDRIDVNGGYTPDNCRWATPKQQSRNRRDNRLITWNGETKTLVEWSEELGISLGGLRYRLKKWTLDQAMTTPFTPKEKLIEWQGQSKTLTVWARDLGVSQAKLWYRLYRLGWTVDRAFTTH